MRVGILFVGGPYPGRSQLLHAGRVRVYAPDGALVASERVADGTTGRFDLKSGRYRFVADSGDARCPQRVLSIEAGTEPNVRITCSIR